MTPTPGTAQPGHQIGNQREAQRLGQDDRGTWADGTMVAA